MRCGYADCRLNGVFCQYNCSWRSSHLTTMFVVSPLLISVGMTSVGVMPQSRRVGWVSVSATTLLDASSSHARKT
ncbi:MAG: hypothetical protein BWY59_00532 [Verrucomicrobia bacterium ADurb.Bin345]|nr:MAG: hypothetical protein BWY59_00532 [Verrucomicrobia bacterium ADurb.Bin345]